MFFKAHLFSVEGTSAINADLCRLAGWKWFGQKEPLRVEEWLLMDFYSWTRERGQWPFRVCVCESPRWLSSCRNNHFKSEQKSTVCPVCFLALWISLLLLQNVNFNSRGSASILHYAFRNGTNYHKSTYKDTLSCLKPGTHGSPKRTFRLQFWHHLLSWNHMIRSCFPIMFSVIIFLHCEALSVLSFAVFGWIYTPQNSSLCERSDLTQCCVEVLLFHNMSFFVVLSFRCRSLVECTKLLIFTFLVFFSFFFLSCFFLQLFL